MFFFFFSFTRLGPRGWLGSGAGVWMDRERQGGGVRAGVWRGRGLWLGWLDHARSLMRGGVGGVGFRVLSEGRWRVEGGGWG